MDTEGFHGPHPKPPKEGCVAIDWSEPPPRDCAVRVRSHTCECMAEVYALCTADGKGCIRRTEKVAGGDRISESPWAGAAEARQLWNDLLEGDAR